MEKRIFIYPSDLVILTGKRLKTCYRNYNILLDCLGKSPKKKITIGEYCKMEEVSEEEIKKALNIA